MKKPLITTAIVALLAAWVAGPSLAQDAKKRPQGKRPGGDFLERIKSLDKNKDGKITKDEATGPFSRMFTRLDANRDDVIDEAEIKRAAERFGQRKPGGGQPARGAGVAEGQAAPDFKLKSVDGKREVTLSAFASRKPVALVFGSYT